jgi:hypothetical protein
MKNKFRIQEIIVTGSDTDGSVIESDWVIKVNKKLVRVESFYFEHNRGIKDVSMLIGKNGYGNIYLLLNNDLKLEQRHKKSFKQISGNRYLLNGEIIKIEKKEKKLDGKLYIWNDIIINCGFLVETSTKLDLKEGDYVVCKDNLILNKIELSKKENES